MRIVWTLVKIAIGLAIAIPLGLFLISAAFGVVGAVVGLTVTAVRLACIWSSLLGRAAKWHRLGLFRLAQRFRLIDA